MKKQSPFPVLKDWLLLRTPVWRLPAARPWGEPNAPPACHDGRHAERQRGRLRAVAARCWVVVGRRLVAVVQLFRRHQSPPVISEIRKLMLEAHTITSSLVIATCCNCNLRRVHLAAATTMWVAAVCTPDDPRRRRRRCQQSESCAGRRRTEEGHFRKQRRRRCQEVLCGWWRLGKVAVTPGAAVPGRRRR